MKQANAADNFFYELYLAPIQKSKNLFNHSWSMQKMTFKLENLVIIKCHVEL